MNTINRYQTFFLLLAVIIGLLLGQLNVVAEYADRLIVPFLMLLLFGIFLHLPINHLIRSFSNIKFLSADLLFNFVWTPLFAFLLGYAFLRNDIALSIGLMMLLVTPCTDWYLIFTAISKGNVPLATSVLPLNLILQIVLLPVYLLIFYGRSGTIDLSMLFESIVIVIVVPFVLSKIVKYLIIDNKRFKRFGEKVSSFFESGQLLFLSLAIVAMFASKGLYLLDNINVVLILLIPLIIFFIVNFYLGRLVSRALHFNYEDSVSLNFVTLARNSPISLALAVLLFPNEPLIPLVLVIAPLIELPVLGVVSQILLKIKN